MLTCQRRPEQAKCGKSEGLPEVIPVHDCDFGGLNKASLYVRYITPPSGYMSDKFPI